MTAADLIHRATAAGVEMTLGNDGRLQLRAECAPSADLLADLTAHKAEIIAVLSTTSAPLQASAWLHLLALANGHVIQRTGDLSTENVEQDARLHYGEDLLTVVAVPGVERPLTDEEIVKALAGTLAAPAPAPASSSAWLARVARLLGTRPAELLEGRHLEQHDLVELAGIDTTLVADTIRNSPAWINRPPRLEQPVAAIRVEEEAEPPHTVHTAATASSDWRAARDHLYPHLMTCRTCHAPAGRYCAAGTGLREHYDKTPWETNE